MNYRHQYHAGNFADVVKHLAEVAILTHLTKKETPFAVIDSHAGRGSYDLESEEALKTGEAASGIQALDGLSGSPLLDRYLSLVGEGSRIYPGSPLIAAKMLRPQDRLVAVEKQLADVQGTIESETAQRDYLRTITDTVKVDVAYNGLIQQAGPFDVSPIRAAADRFVHDVIFSVGQLISCVAYALPWLPLAALAGWIARLLFRRKSH